MIEILIAVWAVIGIACHIAWCVQAKEWCGKPIWQEPSTYPMFIIAAIQGPTYLLAWCFKDMRP